MDVSYQDGREEREIHETNEGALASLREIFERAGAVKEVWITPLQPVGKANLAALVSQIHRRDVETVRGGGT